MANTIASVLRLDALLDGVLTAVGGTPLVPLRRLFRDAPIQVFAKLEGVNPGGSIKDRPALAMIRKGIETGAVGPDTVVIESSSGNLAVGLAQICRYLGLRFVCVVDPKTTRQNLSILRAYGAEIDLVVEPDPTTGEFLVARLNRVHELLERHEHGYWPNQYGNQANSRAHHETMHEITLALPGGVDYLFCAVSTCGTLRGCSEYVKIHGLRTKLVAVDAVGSVIFGDRPGKRLVPGHGAAIRPELFRPDLSDAVVHVTDRDCVAGCRKLVHEEAILAGGSSGAVVAAMTGMAPDLPAGATCVAVLADRGERYLDTIYSDTWVRTHFGEIPAHSTRAPVVEAPVVEAQTADGGGPPGRRGW